MGYFGPAGGPDSARRGVRDCRRRQRCEGCRQSAPAAQQDLNLVVGMGSKPLQEGQEGDGSAGAGGVVRDEEDRG